MVTGDALGVPTAIYTSAEGAAQGEADQLGATQAAFIGDEAAGQRYAILDGSGSVIEEAVFSDAAEGTWKLVSADSCQ